MKLLLLGSALVLLVSAGTQTVKVVGTTICDKRPKGGVTVELWERDTFDPNDLMATVVSDGDGNFEISGSENERSRIEPFLRFKHNCNVKQDGCVRSTEYEVPSKYINSEEAYDMTYVNFDYYSFVDVERC